MTSLWKLVPADRLLLDEQTTHPVDPAAELPVGTDRTLAEHLELHGTHVDREIVAEAHGALIEPTRGWIVRAPNGLVRESLPYATRSDAPSLSRYYAKRIAGTQTRLYDGVLSLRDKHDSNYWHVLSDVLPRLFVFERAGLSLDLPVVVARHLYDAPYFQPLLRRSGLDRLTWVVQDPCVHVRARRAYVCRAFRYSKTHFDRLLELLGAGASDGDRRLFVTRRGRYRSLTNLDEIEQIATEAGLEVVDPGSLTFDEQIAMFAGARKVAGVHGAGLANVLFRAGGALDVLELFSPTWFEPSYFELCRLYGFGYAALVGEAQAGFEFSIPPDRFAAQLERLLAS
jgi:capsular polysaccharide biosynthesis protein